MKYLVTGAGGFVGSELTRRLAARGDRVRAFLRRKESAFNLDKVEAEIFIGDVRDPETVREAMKGVDRVFHTASVYEATPFYKAHSPSLYAINVEGARNVCEAALAAGVKKMVYTGSTAAVGLRDDGRPADETVRLNHLEKRSHYEKSKAQAEELVLSYAAKGLSVVSVNPSFIVGPGDSRPTPTGEVILKFLNRVYPCSFDAEISLSDLESTVQAHLAAMEKGASGKRYIVCSRGMTVREFFRIIAGVSGVSGPALKLPLGLIKIFSLFNEAALGLLGLSGRVRPLIAYELANYLSLGCRYDSALAEKELDFRPQPLDKAVAESVEWYVKYGYVKSSSCRKYQENRSRAYFAELAQESR